MLRAIPFRQARVATAAILFQVAACGDDREPSHESETAGAASTSASSSDSGGSSGTGAGGGSGGEGGGPSQLCEGCWRGVCADASDACLADEACSCVLACDEDRTCEASCPASTAIDALRVCVVEASIDECVAPCEAACEACVIDACRAELDACFAESSCICAAACAGDEACEQSCGDGAAFEAFQACVGGLDPAACAAVCP